MNSKTITAIETQKKNPKRVNIYLNGEFGFGLSTLEAAWLSVNDELSDEKIEQLITGDQFEKAIQSALHFISFRPRSINEVRKNLIKKGIPVEVVESTLERLKNNSILNDQNFAKEWVENRNEFRPRSKMALRMELRIKGVSEEIINSVLESIDEDNLAYQAAKKYLNRLQSLDRFDFRKKLCSFLARRGFGYAIINPIVDQIWNEIQEESKQGNLFNDEEKSWTQ